MMPDQLEPEGEGFIVLDKSGYRCFGHSGGMLIESCCQSPARPVPLAGSSCAEFAHPTLPNPAEI